MPAGQSRVPLGTAGRSVQSVLLPTASVPVPIAQCLPAGAVLPRREHSRAVLVSGAVSVRLSLMLDGIGQFRASRMPSPT